MIRSMPRSESLHLCFAKRTRKKHRLSFLSFTGLIIQFLEAKLRPMRVTKIAILIGANCPCQSLSSIMKLTITHSAVR